jgi:MFS family permease
MENSNDTEIQNDQVRPHPILATMTLSLCSFLNSYLMISMFPYSGFMVLHILPDSAKVTVDTVGSYAGLLASSFMIGRMITSYAWGMLGDIYGRTLLLAGMCSLFFGCSQTWIAALFWRFCAGMSNGTLSVTKTMVTEISSEDETMERRMMGIVVGMRSWGFLLAPALGGALAEPLKQYPRLNPSLWIRKLLNKFPFILPNFLAFILCILAAMMVRCILPETLPEVRRRPINQIPRDTINQIKYLLDSCHKRFRRNLDILVEEDRMLDHHEQMTELLIDDNTTSEQSNLVEPAILSRPLTRKLMIHHGLFAFVSTLVDEIFPLFCMSSQHGLALKEADIGEILSFAGIVFVAMQYLLYIALVTYVGVERSLIIGSILGIQPLLLIPISLAIKNKLWLFVFLAAVMGICKVFHSLFFTCMSLAMNKTVPLSQRATMNGIQLMVGSLARSFGPIVAGGMATLSFSSKLPDLWGCVVAFLVVSIIGWMITFRICCDRMHE